VSLLALLPSILTPYRGFEDDPPPREGGWLAAVSVVLRESDLSRPPSPSPPSSAASPASAPGALELLLIRRATHEGDPWSGDMAFPGGRRDPTDPSLLHTAMRETHEEVAIPLAQRGSLLGSLGVVAPRSRHLPPLTILPLVFRVPAGTEAHRAAPDEVDEVLWVPLGHFRSPTTRTQHKLPHLGGLTFPAFQVGERVVWGLTHRVLTDLLDRSARSGSPGS
jgi:8-oxo-dGTP pyrophosphatase MutT (NUDIX family)